MSATGQCLCGEVRFAFGGEPLFTLHCHCQSCRRFSGAAVATYVGVTKSDFKCEEGAISFHESAPGIRWGSCATCGTSICYEADWCADEIHLLIGTLDTPDRYVPQRHSFYSERLAWLDLASELPKSDESLSTESRD
ncbi:MAG: GFA family protein [Pseudomonadota bacterium]